MTDISRSIPRTGRRTMLLLFGAGECGRLVAREITRHTELNYTIVAVIDDSGKLDGTMLEGVPVTLRSGAERFASQFDEVLIAIPSATPEQLSSITDWCMALGKPVRMIPGYYQMIRPGRAIPSIAREVRLEDLLGRRSRKLDPMALRKAYQGTSVLVTGAGGSIGGELCRQLAELNPSRLGLLDVSEPGLFFVDLDLRDSGFGNCEILLGDATDPGFVRSVMDRMKPDTVFHAAAHKHVPMLEGNVSRAVSNNVVSTRVLLREAEASGVSRFVLVSTDKAVRPTSVMGATKRLCELLVKGSEAAGMIRTIVRFGNVIGSSGSLIPLVKRQIDRGGPVTITDRRMRRFFMSIPEAASLVLHVGATGDNGNVYVLDMGELHEVAAVIEKMIRLTGFEPGRDIEIVETGVRPGEKLTEELSWRKDSMEPTDHPSISVDTDDPGQSEDFDGFIQRLLDRAASGDDHGARDLLQGRFPHMSATGPPEGKG